MKIVVRLVVLTAVLALSVVAVAPAAAAPMPALPLTLQPPWIPPLLRPGCGRFSPVGEHRNTRRRPPGSLSGPRDPAAGREIKAQTRPLADDKRLRCRALWI